MGLLSIEDFRILIFLLKIFRGVIILGGLYQSGPNQKPQATLGTLRGNVMEGVGYQRRRKSQEVKRKVGEPRSLQSREEWGEERGGSGAELGNKNHLCIFRTIGGSEGTDLCRRAMTGTFPISHVNRMRPFHVQCQ